MRGGVTSQPPTSLTIFDPGGVTSGNRYTALGAAVAQARRAGPGSRVMVVANGSTVAGELDLTGVTIVGFGAIQPTLTVVEGTTLISDDSAIRLENVSVSWGGLTPPVQVDPDIGYASLILDRYAKIVTTALSTGPFALGAEGYALLADIGLGCTVDGSAGYAAIEIETNGAFLFANFFSASTLAASTLTGGDDSSIFVTDYGALAVSQIQPGTTNVVYSSH